VITQLFPLRLEIEVVLGVVHEFGEASLGLVAWELCVGDPQVAPAWQMALEQQLLQPSRYDQVHDEQLVRLTQLGHERLDRWNELSA
jgi:hypothetical protein